MNIVIGILLPFFGTSLGAAMVFILRKEMNSKIQVCSLGFASGVMISASFWSLLLPAIELTKQQDKNIPEWFPPSIGFIAGIGFLLLLDKIIPHLHQHSIHPEGTKSSFRKSTMLLLAVALHNIPEGMAVGVVFSSVLQGNVGVSISAAFVLSACIAIQSIPEGAVISLPLVVDGMKKRKAFLYGILTGIIEPIASAVTIFITAHVISAMPYILAFAAGAMIYVVIEELLPDTQTGEHNHAGTISAAIGFILMMILDVAFG